MSLGFIILRHVRCEKTNKYWIECYKCIRKFYETNTIIIIDDNSDYKYITHIKLTHTIVINSEYKGSGEVLPYIYYLENNLFDTAAILHDSVFIQRYINFSNKPKFLWHFLHNWDDEKEEERLLKESKFDNLLDFYRNKSAWRGCFGAMTVMPYKTLETIDKKYNLKNLTNVINNRDTRKCFERLIGALIISEGFVNTEKCSLFGEIHDFIRYGYSYENYIEDKPRITKSIIKIWSGR
jgi:hypothetical protein